MTLRFLILSSLALLALSLSCDRRLQPGAEERTDSVGPDDPDPRVNALRKAAKPLDTPTTFSTFLSNAPDRRLFLLGESTHGTSEYYTIRTELSQALITAGHANFVGVEGDWAAIASLNEYVQHRTDSPANEIAKTLDRWPSWMWANAEFVEFVEWLREYNTNRTVPQRVGLYGIDVYGPDRSIAGLKEYFAKTDRPLVALEKLRCIRPFAEEFRKYAQHLRGGGERCTEPLAALTRLVAEDYKSSPNHQTLDALQMAYVVKSAEQHYRAMVHMDQESSWNSRVDHFADTIERLLEFHDQGLGVPGGSKGIVWAHNTHVGDARATSMGERGDRNIGQITRERHGDSKVKIVGFSTHRGKLLAGQKWGQPVEVMEMPEAQTGSVDDLFNRTGLSRFMVRLEDVADQFSEEIGHRAIGVTYSPASDSRNYVPTRLAARYTWLVFVDETTPLKSLH